MSDIIEADGYDLPAIADDSLVRIAREAEARIDAVNKIKQIALKVTNVADWTDQQDKPYLQVSGAEKIAAVFNVSWRIDEPICETEPDGHYTFTYTGTFSIPGRSIEITGSRSSKDPFFKKYEWTGPEGKKVRKELPISAIDRRDVKMAAMTNLLGNGITRLLGIRNLSWSDLAEFAGINKDQVTAIQYKKEGKTRPPVSEPKSKGENGGTTVKDPAAPASEPQIKAIHAILGKLGITDDLEKHEKVSNILVKDETLTSFTALTKGEASTVIEALSTEAGGK